MKHKQTVVFDFDGVIHSYVSGWQGTDTICDPPVKGIKEAIDEIRLAGYEVVVVSTRCKTNIGYEAIERYLDMYDIKVDRICSTKPPAIAYIDDRAIEFNGNTACLLHKIKTFMPWTNNKNLVKKYVDTSELIEDEVEETKEDLKFGKVNCLSTNTKDTLYKFISVLDKEELAAYIVGLYRTKDSNKTANIEKDIKYSTFCGKEDVDRDINERIIRKYGSL